MIDPDPIMQQLERLSNELNRLDVSYVLAIETDVHKMVAARVVPSGSIGMSYAAAIAEDSIIVLSQTDPIPVGDTFVGSVTVQISPQLVARVEANGVN